MNGTGVHVTSDPAWKLQIMESQALAFYPRIRYFENGTLISGEAALTLTLPALR